MDVSQPWNTMVELSDSPGRRFICGVIPLPCSREPGGAGSQTPMQFDSGSWTSPWLGISFASGFGEVECSPEVLVQRSRIEDSNTLIALYSPASPCGSRSFSRKAILRSAFSLLLFGGIRRLTECTSSTPFDTAKQ
jgi:hypothetical protein